MFYPNQPVVENPLSKPLPAAPVENKNAETNKVIHLPNQRFYQPIEEDHKTRRITINMSELQDMVHYPKPNTMDLLKHKGVQKATWADNPLRLCLVESQAPPTVQSDDILVPFSRKEMMPNTYKLKSKAQQEPPSTAMDPNPSLNKHSPHVDEDNKTIDKELPFATAPFMPPKEMTTTPACPPPIILPVETYSDDGDHLNPAQPWLYSREKESWEAIFHPLSTFKHNKGELEYYAWNSVNLPVAAALVAQRVTHPTSHSMSTGVVEPTIPHIMPTPSLKPSPILTIVSAEDGHAFERDKSEITLINNHHEAAQEGYYYDMLQKIRGSNASSLLDESCSTLQSNGMSVMDKDENQHTQTLFKRYILAAALLLGGFNRNKATNNTPPTLPSSSTTTTPPPATAHNAYAMDDEKPIARADPETLFMIRPRYWTEKKLFWTGFVCPLLWYYGSVHMKASSSNSGCRLLDPSDLRWQKRCRLAALYFSVILSVVILVTSVKAAGSAGARQTQTGTIRAVIAD